jgi:hypothetical protein
MPSPTGQRDVHAAAGPIFTPFIGLHAVAYAGVGIPGVSVGIEGDIALIRLEAPVHMAIGVSRMTKPDPRPLPSELAGQPTAIPHDKVYDWQTSWQFGANARLRAMDGTLSLAARVRLLFFKKTLRQHIAHWKGFEVPFKLIGTDGGGPLADTSYLGPQADDIAYTIIDPIEPGVVEGPDVDAEFTGPLGADPCGRIPR